MLKTCVAFGRPRDGDVTEGDGSRLVDIIDFRKTPTKSSELPGAHLEHGHRPRKYRNLHKLSCSTNYLYVGDPLSLPAGLPSRRRRCEHL